MSRGPVRWLPQRDLSGLFEAEPGDCHLDPTAMGLAANRPPGLIGQAIDAALALRRSRSGWTSVPEWPDRPA